MAQPDLSTVEGEAQCVDPRIDDADEAHMDRLNSDPLDAVERCVAAAMKGFVIGAGLKGGLALFGILGRLRRRASGRWVQPIKSIYRRSFPCLLSLENLKFGYENCISNYMLYPRHMMQRRAGYLRIALKTGELGADVPDDTHYRKIRNVPVSNILRWR